MRYVIPGDPAGDHGEIAMAWQIVGDRVCLIHVDESRSEIGRAELQESARWFSDYLDACLVQLKTHPEIRNSVDRDVIDKYLGIYQGFNEGFDGDPSE
jgi:hypothetical protein